MLFPALVYLIALVCLSHAIDYCPLLGAVYPVPRNVNSNTLTRSAVENLTKALDQAIREDRTPYGDVSSNSNSFSISVISANEDKPIFQYQHTAKLLDNSSTTAVTGDTIFRIGSVAKIFTTLALLLQQGIIIFDDPVTKFIPELAAIANTQANGTFDPVSEVQWKDVTIGALASHLAGIGRDYNRGDLAGSDIRSFNSAFPALNGTDIPNCNVKGKKPACSRDAFFRGFTARHPVLAPFTTPVYSNAGFVILGYVVEKITGQPYETAVDESILKPLSMTRTSVKKPLHDSQGVIPEGGNFEWGYDYGNSGPAEGLYSSTNDLSNFSRAILRSSLLQPVETRRWLKPRANTASLRSSVGAPWEIERVTRNTSDNEVIDLYTKAGSTGIYNSLLVLIPDYEVAFTVLTAGNVFTLADMLSEMIAETFLPVIYLVSKEEAAVAFGGVYESPGANSSLSLIVDDGPGLFISNWTSDGTDFLSVYQEIGYGKVEARIYPTGLKSSVMSGNSTAEVSYRGIFQSAQESVPDPKSRNRHRRIFNSDCATWMGVDAVVYGHNAIDDFVFQLDRHGKALSVEPRALRVHLTKKSQLSGINSTVIKGG